MMSLLAASSLAGGGVCLVLALFFKQVWFGLCFFWLVMTLTVTLPVVHLVVPSKRGKFEWSERICHLLFCIVFKLCPWASLDNAPSNEDWIRVIPNEAMKRGAVVMVNHTSYMDGFLFSALTPFRVIERTRTLMKSSLFSVPVLGGVFTRLGHLPVYFVRETDNNSFSVDKERQAKVTQTVRAHLAGGGVLAFCPEGGINRKDPTKLLSFRRGTFQMIAELGVPIFGLTMYGNHVFWPPAAQMGGLPSTIIADVFAVEDWNAHVEKPEMDAAALCAMCESRMQRSLDLCVARAVQAGVAMGKVD